MRSPHVARFGPAGVPQTAAVHVETPQSFADSDAKSNDSDSADDDSDDDNVPDLMDPDDSDADDDMPDLGFIVAQAG